jgi:hypothetical protein
MIQGYLAAAVFFAPRSNPPYHFPTESESMRNLLLALVLVAGGSQTVAQTNTGVIEGRVLNSATQEPVTNVQITLVAPAPGNPTANLAPDASARLAQQIADLIESGNRAGVGQAAIDNAIANAQRNAGGAVGAQTNLLVDSESRFTFKGLAPGRYAVRATREGFFGPPVNGTPGTLVTKNVTVEADKPTAPVEFVMTPGGIISGRVRDPNGQAVSGVQIAAYRVAYPNGRKNWTVASTKTTDDRGEYRMFWLAPGEYYVGATPRASGPVPGPQDSWARTFFPGVIEPEAATLIVINKGGEATGVDINIRSSATPTFKISGVARNPYARPNAAGSIDQSINQFYLVPRDPGVFDPVNPPVVPNSLPINARPNGEFEIRNVRSGSYDLIPHYLDNPLPVAPGTPAPTSPPIRRYMLSHNSIEVRNADVTGLTLSVGPGVNLSGEVVIAAPGPQPIKLETARLTLRNLSSSPPQLSSIIGAIPVDASGKFSVTGVPQDRYAFNVTGVPDTFFVADIRQGGASVFDSGFLVDGNANPVQVVLDGGGVQVGGTVLNAERKPASGAMVTLVPVAGRRQYFPNAVTDDSGHFGFRGVPPGRYIAYAFESILPNAWQNAEYLSQYEVRGRPLTVERQSQPEMQLDLIPVESRR